MAVTANWYGLGVKAILAGSVDLDTDTFKAMLTTSSYTPNQDTDDFRNDVTNEISGTGYTTGGVTITSNVLSYDATSNEIRWDFDDPTWTGASFTANKMVVYKSRGGASSADEVIVYVSFGADNTVSAGTFTYVVPATGFAVGTVS